MNKNIICVIAGILSILAFMGIGLAFMTTNILWFLFSLTIGLLVNFLIKKY